MAMTPEARRRLNAQIQSVRARKQFPAPPSAPTDDPVLAELRRQNELLAAQLRHQKKVHGFSPVRVLALTIVVLIVLALLAL